MIRIDKINALVIVRSLVISIHAVKDNVFGFGIRLHSAA